MRKAVSLPGDLAATERSNCYHFASFLLPSEVRMPTLVVKNLPQPLHERLKAQAQEHHRSMTKEVVALIEQGLLAPRSTRAPARQLPPLVRLSTGPVTTEWIEAAIAEGRD